MHMGVKKMHKSVIDKSDAFCYNKLESGKEDIAC